MDERVVNLLSLCLVAKTQGVNVWFYFSPHVDGISIYALKEGWETCQPYEIPERYFDFRIFLDFDKAEEQIAEAEQAIKDLIKERGKSE